MVLISSIGTGKTPYFCFRYDDTAGETKHDHSPLGDTSLSRSAAPYDNGTRHVNSYENPIVSIYDEIHDENSDKDYTSLTRSTSSNYDGTRHVNNHENPTDNIYIEIHDVLTWIVYRIYRIFHTLEWHTCRSLNWHHNERDGVSNHQPIDCLINRLFRCKSKKTSKLRTTSLCARNSPVSGHFPTQRTSNAKNVSIWWRFHGRDIWCSNWGPFVNLFLNKHVKKMVWNV